VNEIQSRASELRKIAAECDTVQDFARRMSWPMSSAHAANDQLKLNLPIIRKSGRSTTPKAAQACPKPTGKAKA
jgi:predicted phage tail protein